MTQGNGLDKNNSYITMLISVVAFEEGFLTLKHLYCHDPGHENDMKMS